MQAVIRELHEDLAHRLHEHYAVGGLLPEEELDALDELARQRGVSRAAVALSVEAPEDRIPD